MQKLLMKSSKRLSQILENIKSVEIWNKQHSSGVHTNSLQGSLPPSTKIKRWPFFHLFKEAYNLNTQHLPLHREMTDCKLHAGQKGEQQKQTSGPAACRPLRHPHHPTGHHTQCPTDQRGRAPLGLHMCCSHQQGGWLEQLDLGTEELETH